MNRNRLLITANITFAAVCILGFLIQFSIYVKHYMDYPIQTLVEISFGENPEHPAVTICNENRFRKTELLKKFHELKVNKSAQCEKPSDSCELWKVHFDSETLVQLGHNFSDLVKGIKDEVMDDYEDEPASYDYCPTYHPLYGNCYAVKGRFSEKACPAPSNETLTDAKAIFKAEIRFQFLEYWYWKPAAHKFRTPVAMLSLHDSTELPNMREDVYEIDPGYKITILVQKTETMRLPAPYKTNCVEYEELESEPDSKQICEAECVSRAYYFDLGYVVPRDYYWHIKFTVPLHKINPEPRNRTEGAPSAEYRRYCRMTCPDECRTINYEYQTARTMMGFRKSNHGSTRDDLLLNGKLSSIVKIRFKSFEFKTFVMKPQIQGVELFGYLGGYLGVWLGVSLLSLPRRMSKLWMFVRHRYSMFNVNSTLPRIRVNNRYPNMDTAITRHNRRTVRNEG